MSHVPAERVLGILELLAEGASALSLGEIAERLALPKSGAHRLLATLVDLGWAEKETERGYYRLTMRLAILASFLVDVISSTRPNSPSTVTLSSMRMG